MSASGPGFSRTVRGTQLESDAHVDSRQLAAAFGVALRAARESRGLTQEELAFSSGLDRTYPSLLERGKRQPTIAVMIRLAFVLSMPPSQLLDETIATYASRSRAECLLGNVLPG